MAKIISSRLSRTALLASVATAGLCLGTAGQLRAQTMGPALNSGLTSEYREAQGGSASASGITGDYLEPQRDYIGAVKADPQVLIADPNTPVTAQDPTNITGVGQMVADIGGGFIGLCTGTLINPRTVIFAAHCVNENAATDYGSPSGGIPIGFGFQQDNLPATRDWFLPGPGQYMTNIANAFYNSNYVAYHPGSLEPESAGFLYSDVAVASLDTPASNIPTWALLFSALPDPGEIGAEGTGYHVTIDGYGRNGTGSTGASASVDFRRRIAENIVGSLASLDDFELFLFYGLRTSDGYTEGLPQNLYWIDFDDPKRGTPDASPFDFNAWRDNALPNEGITSSGDSGGPLILDQTFDSPVVIGVLSGGYSRFFNGQPTNGYGTASFYQPLYLYWDWIAANNPYHYVTAKAGDGDWSDPDHWLTMLDPNYKIIDANGNLVNGVPTAPGAGNTDQPGFGQVCYQAGGLSDCYDVSTGDEIFDVRPIGTSDLSNDRDVVSATALGDGTGSTSGSTTTTAAADEEPTLPAATLANGLPGASGFVPDDYDGDRTIGEAPRYFDVTLSAAGTTTLSDRVTVDRLTMSGMGAALDIKAGGSLTSLIDINQLSGMIRVDGTLKTFGDYFLMSGGLQGSGVISTPYFTNVAGVIAPGGVGGIGSLRFYGDVILSSASTLLIDLGANGVSDRINVSATTFEEEGDGIMTAAVGDPTNGIASLGGQVAFGATAGTKLRAGSSYTFLIAEGGITGSFDSTSPTAISAILKPVLSYTANSVKVTIKAGFYRNVIDSTSPVQVAYATLLDQNRGAYNKFATLYGEADLLSAAGVQGTFESMAPRTETLRTSLGEVLTDNMSKFYRQRLNQMDTASMGGSITMIGQPLQMAAASMAAAAVSPDMAASSGETTTRENALPEDMSMVLAGGYLDGSSAPMRTAIPFGKDKFDGWYFAAALEKLAGDNAVIGMGLSYSELDGDTATADTAKAKLYQLSLYGKLNAGPLTIDGIMNAGALETDTKRSFAVGAVPYTLRGSDGALAISGELGISSTMGSDMFSITPRASLRGAYIGYTDLAEQGGDAGLLIQNRNMKSVQGRLGATVKSEMGGVKPFLTANYVHEFKDQPAFIQANLIGGLGNGAAFALGGQDQDWGEIGGGLTVGTGAMNISLSADTTVARKDVKYQTYRASVKIAF